ncbi:MAG: S-methyl-5'-thioadenosine phosphorylase [Candidatus Bathyarchaeota archaeon]|nr:MAG: S-methyl-5'-thioadenosine phosphorylase [Candidatus Bathyarchaeota archaeon]
MGKLRKAEIAIIGGTGLEALLKSTKQILVETPYGLLPPTSVGKIDKKTVAFLPRHGIHHSVPPHQVNYRANVYGLHKIGVKRITATNAVGAINLDFKPGDLVVPHDLIDFTRCRQLTFYDETPVTHIDVSQPYCPEIRGLLIEKAKEFGVQVRDQAVLVCTEGPRYETPAEIEMFRQLGCDIVGMTGMPEAVLARELEICYATLCFVSNLAAGMQRRLTANEVVEVAKQKLPIMQQILREAVKHLPEDRCCPCAHALRDARLRG